MTLMTPEEEAKYKFKCNVNFDDIFSKCFAGADIKMCDRIKKCFEENEEFLQELKEENFSERAISELMDVIQSHISLFMALVYSNAVDGKDIKKWKEKQNKRYIEYCLKDR